MRALRLISVAALVGMLASWGYAEEGGPCTAESLLGTTDATNSPVAIHATLKACSLSEGISLRVEIENKSPVPYRLGVCPSMKLCCVKGLHPMVAYGEKGKSLRDTCAVQKPTDHEVFLPSGAAFSFNMKLGPDSIPKEALEAGNVIHVFLSYDLPEQKFIHSNVVKAELH